MQTKVYFSKKLLCDSISVMLLVLVTALLPVRLVAQIMPVLPNDIGANINESNIGRNYYVATNGNDATNTGTQASPFASLFKAIEQANAISLANGTATKIFVANGTYTIPKMEYDYRDPSMDPDAKNTTLVIQGASYGGVILNGNGSGRLHFRGKSNLVMRNLSLTNCGGTQSFGSEEFFGNQASVVQPQSKNWLIEYCTFNNNKNRGVRILHVDHLTMHHCQIKDNGDDGFQYIGRESHLHDMLISGNDFFDTTGDYGNGGFSFASKRSLVENMTVRGNKGAGFRGDFQNENVIVKNCIFEDNRGGGVIIEVTFGSILFLNCSIERNNFGFRISASHNVTIDGCRIKNNKLYQVDVESQLRDQNGECGVGGPPSDLDQLKWHCNPLKTLDGVIRTTIRNSFISTNKGEASALFHYGTFDSQPNKKWYPNWYRNEFVGNNNTYFKSDTQDAFITDFFNSSGILVPRMSNLAEWKTLTASESGSIWQESDTTFSAIEYYGNTSNYAPGTIKNWDVTGLNERYSIINGDYNNLSGNRLGEYSIIKKRDFANFTMTLIAAATENFNLNTSPDYAVVFAFKDSENYCYASFTPTGTILYQVLNGVRQTAIASSSMGAFSDDSYNNLEIIRIGNKVTVKRGGVVLVEKTDTRLGALGRVGVGSFNDAVSFDDINVVGTHTVAMFAAVNENQSNLTGPDATLPESQTLKVYPNPVVHTSTVNYYLPQAGKVKLVVYDGMGRIVSTLVDGEQAAGSHQAQLNGQTLPEGIYYIKLQTTKGTQTTKILISK